MLFKFKDEIKDGSLCELQNEKWSHMVSVCLFAVQKYLYFVKRYFSYLKCECDSWFYFSIVLPLE